MSCCWTMDAPRFSVAEAAEVLRCIRCAACLNHCPIYGAIGGHAYGATYPGPIGAALNPGLMGLTQAHHHPNASTFCGRCAEVCPVKIPLPTIMRHWRAKEFEARTAPKAMRWAFALGVCGEAARPLPDGGACSGAAAEMLGGHDGAVHSLPLMHGWFAVRDFPAPTARRFRNCGGRDECARRNPARPSARKRALRYPDPFLIHG